MKVLMVLTSHAQLGDTGNKTGFWLEEFTAPYYAFRDAGAEVTLASPKGGQPPVDPNSEADEALTDSTRRFSKDAAAKSAMSSTKKLADVTMDAFDAVFFPGGHGPLWDLVENRDVIRLLEAAGRDGKVVGAVCHGPAVFRDAETPSGDYFVNRRKVTGFSNSEEESAQLTQIVPFLVEDMLKSCGAAYSCGPDWSPHIVVDGNLITGQNPASSEGAAKAVLQALEEEGTAG